MKPDITSIDEAHDLERLEAIVAKGLQTLFEVSEALTEIRDRKLYRRDYKTFDAYLKIKWKISRSWACRQIQAAETAKMLPMGNEPVTERQLRPLAKLPLGQRAAAWKEAAASSPTGTPTAKQVEAVVSKRTLKQPEEAKTPLQQITDLIKRLWTELSSKERDMLCNCISGLRGGS